MYKINFVTATLVIFLFTVLIYFLSNNSYKYESSIKIGEFKTCYVIKVHNMLDNIDVYNKYSSLGEFTIYKDIDSKIFTTLEFFSGYKVDYKANYIIYVYTNSHGYDILLKDIKTKEDIYNIKTKCE